MTLNTWGGRAGKEKLLAFFEEQKHLTHIFCLQEMWSAPYESYEGVLAGGKPLSFEEIMTHGIQDITSVLSEHHGYFCPYLWNSYGIMTYIHSSLPVIDVGEHFIYKDEEWINPEDIGDHARALQYVTVQTTTTPLTVINLHGLWNGKGKDDTPDRIYQSESILSFAKTCSHPVVVAGDFNLLPETQSIRLLENAGFNNLIKQYGITSTRTALYTKPQKFADYIFTSPDLPILQCSVLPDEVSDHSAVVAEIDLP